MKDEYVMLNVKLKPIDEYDIASIDKPMIYAIQNKTTKRIVAVFNNPDMARAMTDMLDARKILYFTDGYVMRELYKGEHEWVAANL